MDIESAVTSFCKRTPTAKIAWREIVAKFLKMYPGISREDFELCMLRQGKRAAVAVKNSCASHCYDEAHKVLGVTKGFWDVCQNSRRPKKVEGSREDVPATRRGYHRNPTTKIYLTVFQIAADEYSKEAVDILKRFIESLERPLQVIECMNPHMIEVREFQRGKL